MIALMAFQCGVMLIFRFTLKLEIDKRKSYVLICTKMNELRYSFKQKKYGCVGTCSLSIERNREVNADLKCITDSISKKTILTNFTNRLC